MNTGQTAFSQVMARIPHWEFQRAYKSCSVALPRSNALSAWDHFLALCFAQMTFRQSLRDIEACLKAQNGLAYHMGFRSVVTRSSLARANEQRDWEPWAYLARKLMPKVRALYQDELAGVDIDAPLIAIDSTLIDLSLALCPWADYTGGKAAQKMHAALDLRGPIPAFINVTEATASDMSGLDNILIEPGSVYVLDRGYVDFARLRRLADKGAFFVIRARADVSFYVAQSRPIDRNGILRADQTIRFNGTDVPHHWPGDLRRVTIFDPEHSLHLVFWTNLWTVPASTIAAIYKQRWQIELFFRWLKHGLCIQTFYGVSERAVRLQLWASICTYLAMAITRKQLGITTNLTTFIQVLSLHAISKEPIHELFGKYDTRTQEADSNQQLLFNDLN